MHASTHPLRIALLASFLLFGTLALVPSTTACGDPEEFFAETFDAHWERLNDAYPYFELYGVDWEAERDFHRPRALAAANPDEFAWELARLISALPDPHVSYIPSIETIAGRWSYPELESYRVERRSLVMAWPAGTEPSVPPQFAEDSHAYPEILTVRGEPLAGAAEILAGGPLGSEFEIRLRWPDGTEADHVLRRPEVSNLPPPKKHFGKRWLVTGRIGSIGYLRVKTFDPKLGTLGPDGKMTTMLRGALAELKDADGLVLDLQANGGGLVAASDPFLGNLLERSLSYKWGNSGGQRVIRPGRPRYKGQLVAIVDERSASGGEWAARILRDAGRATVVGGRTVGAEAAVHTSTGADGSVVKYSAWPMVEPGRAPFQEVGIEVDHFLPLLVADVREHGYEGALERVRRARFAQALEVLGAPAESLDALVAMAKAADELDEGTESLRK